MAEAVAEVVQPNDDFWYLDKADALSVETEGEIFFANQRLYDACGAEIVVVAIDSTDDMAIDDYAYTLFNEWEIGGSKYLGFLLLMAVEDEDYYAMPGTMLGAYIDSARIADMLDNHLLPEFSRKNYDAGARKFFEAVYAEVVDVLNLDLSIDEAKKDYEAFVRADSTDRVQQEFQPALMEKNRISIGSIALIILLLIILSKAAKRFRTEKRMHVMHPAHTFASSRQRHSHSVNSSAVTGYLLGRMAGAARNHHSGSVPPFGGRGMSGNARSNSVRTFGANSFNRAAGGSVRMKTGNSSRTLGGFGGASRSGGASRGPSTRGGGAGRFSRR